MASLPHNCAVPAQTGQSAFAAIQEIIALLEADPMTDWSKVDIEALRQHLIDMDNFALHAEVKSEEIAGGMRFAASGAGAVGESIRRMTQAHAAVLDGVDGWRYAASPTAGGATLTVLVPRKDTETLVGLGFIGMLTRGMHHAIHHLRIARGMTPH